MRRLILSGAVLALAAAGAWAGEAPAMSEARRAREEITARLADETTVVARLSAEVALSRSDGREAAGRLALGESRIRALERKLRDADRRLATLLRKSADEAIRAVLRPGADAFESDARRIVSMLREADRHEPLEVWYPPPDRRVAGAVAALVAEADGIADAGEAQRILSEYQGRMIRLRSTAEAEAARAHERRILLLRLSARYESDTGVAAYARELEMRTGLLVVRIREYEGILAQLPSRIITQ